MREVGLDDALGGLVHIGELKELRLLLVEQVREVLDAVLELGVELRPVVALEIVRNNDSSLVFLRLALLLNRVR